MEIELKSHHEVGSMAIFEERQRGEEERFRHDQELTFRVRNRRNRLFGLWIATEHLGLAGEPAAAYAETVLLADLERPGDADMLGKVSADLDGAGKGGVGEVVLRQRLAEIEAVARQQVMAE